MKKRSDFLLREPVYEGKTKVIYPTLSPGIVEICNKDDVTIRTGDTRDMFLEKGKICNEITCLLFNLLARYDIKSHFIKKASKESFYAWECDMIPVEVVVRRVASGSYLKRNLGVMEGVDFENPVVEFFYKDGLSGPFIDFSDKSMDPLWSFYDQKKPISENNCFWKMSPLLTKDETKEVQRRAVNIFLFLEWFWKQKQFKFFNFKLEFGRIKSGLNKGSLVWADVLTPDEWVLVKDGFHYDRESFRSGAPASVLRESYKIVAQELSILKNSISL